MLLQIDIKIIDSFSKKLASQTQMQIQKSFEGLYLEGVTVYAVSQYANEIGAAKEVLDLKEIQHKVDLFL